MQLSAPALVRPRCYDPDTGDVVLLEDEVGDFLRTHNRGAIEILGGRGAGKTCALEFLATLSLAGVRLIDNATAQQIAAPRLSPRDALYTSDQRAHFQRCRAILE